MVCVCNFGGGDSYGSPGLEFARAVPMCVMCYFGERQEERRSDEVSRHPCDAILCSTKYTRPPIAKLPSIFHAKPRCQAPTPAATPIAPRAVPAPPPPSPPPRVQCEECLGGLSGHLGQTWLNNFLVLDYFFHGSKRFRNIFFGENNPEPLEPGWSFSVDAAPPDVVQKQAPPATNPDKLR